MDLPTIEAQELAHEFPASFVQRTALASRQAFNRVHWLRLDGCLDEAGLARAMALLVQRHEVLRTVFRKREGAWRQIVLDQSPVELQRADHNHLDAAGQRIAADSLAVELAQGCTAENANALFRSALIRHGPSEHLCVLAASSLVLDIFSFEILGEELGAIYAVETQAAPGPLPEPGMQYADYALWEAEMRSSVEPETGSSRTSVSSAHATARDRPTFVQRKLGPVIERHLSDPGEDGGPLLAALAAFLPPGHPGEAGILTDGRYSPELERALGPLQRMLPFSVSAPAGCTPASQGTSLAPVCSAMRNAEVSSSTLQPTGYSVPRPVLLVDGSLGLSFAFAPGIGATWETLEDHAPHAHQEGSHLTLRLLKKDGELHLGVWSRTLLRQALDPVADRFVSLLDHAVQRPDEPFPTQNEESPAHQDKSHAEPKNQVEAKLAEIWSTVLRIPSIGRDENFFDLGGHSLLAVKISTRIERAFGREVPLNAILEKPTIAEFALLLAPVPQAQSALANPAHRLICIKEPASGGSAPFYWVPGGRAVSVMALREVSLQLGPERSVYGIESRLPEPSESFLSVPDRAQQYVGLIRKQQPHGPYLLAGFCQGGMVAFEVAQQLRRQGEEVAFLGLVQASMPGFLADKRKRRRVTMQRRLYLLQTAFQFIRLRVLPGAKRVPREQRQEIMDKFAKLLTGWVGTSSQLPDETQQMNEVAMMPYRPTRYDGAVHIFLARDCFESAGISAELDPRRAWSTVVAGSETVLVEGDHVTMLTQSHARSLADALRSVLPD